MRWTAFLAAVLLMATVLVATAQDDPSYDHQTTTYTAHLEAQHDTSLSLTVTPFFSPDTSADVLTSIVEEADTSVEIFTPGFSSWSGCTNFSGCTGCTVEGQRNESFPIFQALLNALHRGVSVRLITNDYGTPTCAGKIDPLTFLALNGAQIRYYTSTTFMHTKYMSSDGKRATVSSINYTYTSIMKNREAGVHVVGTDFAKVHALWSATFESDWAQATPFKVQQSYSSDDMKIITDKAKVPVVIPPPNNFPGAYVTKLQPVTGTFDILTFASPDYAWDNIKAGLNAVKSNFSIAIYQITDPDLCQAVIDMHNNGVDVRVLVSDHIYSEPDYESAQKCYTELYHAGLTVRKTASRMYTFTHAKFWILDGEHVGMSTGNWSPTDYPQASTFPPYGNSEWRRANRDITVVTTQTDVVAQFTNVLSQDYERGFNWTPRDGLTLIPDDAFLRK